MLDEGFTNSISAARLVLPGLQLHRIAEKALRHCASRPLEGLAQTVSLPTSSFHQLHALTDSPGCMHPIARFVGHHVALGIPNHPRPTSIERNSISSTQKARRPQTTLHRPLAPAGCRCDTASTLGGTVSRSKGPRPPRGLQPPRLHPCSMQPPWRATSPPFSLRLNRHHRSSGKVSSGKMDRPSPAQTVTDDGMSH